MMSGLLTGFLRGFLHVIGLFLLAYAVLLLLGAIGAIGGR
jgi:hypothetical protein